MVHAVPQLDQPSNYSSFLQDIKFENAYTIHTRHKININIHIENISQLIPQYEIAQVTMEWTIS